ncbi:MAG: sugar phosphate isomerase/epimerase [Chloroflexi bacterium]|nr:sugar phosphate isomerase/epimerase [Chloroflexota bacterium]
MKIALAVAPHDAQPSAFVVFRDRLEVSIAKAARMGYDGIELALGRADDVVAGQVAALLDHHRMGISAISTGRVFAEQRAWLTSPDGAVRGRAVEILQGLVELAAELGVRRVNVGRVRGFIPEGETLEIAETRFVAGISEVAAHALPHGIDIVVEPVNRYEINYVNSVDPDGIRLVERLGLPNVTLMPDVFHMNVEDASIAASLVAAGAKVGYVHLADSNRWAPGQGHTDFVAILDALRTIGYDDWVAVEILPYPSADEAAEQAITYLRTLIPAASA